MTFEGISTTSRLASLRSRAARVFAFVCFLAVMLVVPRPSEAAAFAPGFYDEWLASLIAPTGLAFTPDGRMLVTTQPGLLRVYANGALLTAPALDISNKICTNRERGLLGIGVDPAFTSNHFIYLYYTLNVFSNDCPLDPAQPTPVNRVSRFTLPSSNLIDPATEFVVMDNIPSPTGYHNAGDVQFGADGLLYASVGDGVCQARDVSRCGGGLNDNAQNLSTPLGKILRINKDGSIPLVNPYASAIGSRKCTNRNGVPAGTGPCKEIFAYGLRNPFRFAFKPGTNQFYINDVGQSTWEEVDDGASNANYGWNVREGHCQRGSTTLCGTPPPGMTNPIHDYSHEYGCTAITGGVFAPTGVWPAPYGGSYFYSDFSCGQIRFLVPRQANPAKFDAWYFGPGSAIAMVFGPAGPTRALYYVTYDNGGEIHRILYTPTNNRPPSAELAASPTNGDLPLTVHFNGTGSADPDPGDALTYLWNFGDGATTQTFTPTVDHTYTTAGTYTASLVVKDLAGALSPQKTMRIDAGNNAPIPTIASPSATLKFTVGQQLTLSGAATDPEDGPLPGSALSWSAVLHHADHVHPYLAETQGAQVTISAPAPEGFDATDNSYLEVFLTATDSRGLRATVGRAVMPLTVQLSFETYPSSLKLHLNGDSYTAPFSLVSWAGYVFTAYAPDQRRDGKNFKWTAWSDGGTRTHLMTTPSSNQFIWANFKKVLNPL